MLFKAREHSYTDSEADSNSDSDDMDECSKQQCVDTILELLSRIQLVGKKKICQFVNIFDLATQVSSRTQGLVTTAKSPPRVFSRGDTAFRFSCDPSLKQISIIEAAVKLGASDFKQALYEYHGHLERHGDISCKLIGRWHDPLSCNLPFESIQVWYKMRMQNRAFHLPHDALSAQTVNCQPPCERWPYGHYDSVLLNTKSDSVWPKSGLHGKMYACCCIPC